MQPAGFFAIQGHDEGRLGQVQHIKNFEAAPQFVGVARQHAVAGFLPDAAQVMPALQQEAFIAHVAGIVEHGLLESRLGLLPVGAVGAAAQPVDQGLFLVDDGPAALNVGFGGRRGVRGGIFAADVAEGGGRGDVAVGFVAGRVKAPEGRFRPAGG